MEEILNPLRLVVYPIIFSGFYTSQVVSRISEPSIEGFIATSSTWLTTPEIPVGEEVPREAEGIPCPQRAESPKEARQWSQCLFLT